MGQPWQEEPSEKGRIEARGRDGMTGVPRHDTAALPDIELARRIARRDPAAVRTMTEQNNQRLFRAAWSILGNRSEAEDAVQAAYFHAFRAIGSFAGQSSLSTWLTRIVINEARGRLRAARRRSARLNADSILDLEEYRDKLMSGSIQRGGPDGALAIKQLRGILEAAIAKLPEDFRLPFVMREVEGMSIDDIAAALDIVPGTVKTRLLRARRRLREALAPDLRASLTGAFPFAGADCEAMTEKVIAQLCGDQTTGSNVIE